MDTLQGYYYKNEAWLDQLQFDAQIVNEEIDRTLNVSEQVFIVLMFLLFLWQLFKTLDEALLEEKEREKKKIEIGNIIQSLHIAKSV